MTVRRAGGVLSIADLAANSVSVVIGPKLLFATATSPVVDPVTNHVGRHAHAAGEPCTYRKADEALPSARLSSPYLAGIQLKF